MIQINTNFSEDTPITYTVSGLPEINTDKWKVSESHTSSSDVVKISTIDDTKFSIMCTADENTSSDIQVETEYHDMPISKENTKLSFKWNGTYVAPVYPLDPTYSGTYRINNGTYTYSVQFSNEFTYPVSYVWSIEKSYSPEGSTATVTGTASGNTFSVVYSGIDSEIDKKTSWNIKLKVISKYNSEKDPLFEKTYNIHTNIVGPVITVSSNPKLLAICYHEGWCESSTEMYQDECESITNIGTVFSKRKSSHGLDPITSFEEFKYFTGVKNIPDYAFYENEVLTNITLPSSIETIGNYAFGGTSNKSGEIYKLKYCSVISSECKNIKSIGNYAFYGCGQQLDTGSKIINISEQTKLENIGEYAFYQSNLSEADFTNCTLLTELSNGIFSDCDKMISCTLPSNIVTIPYQLFFGCDRINNIIIPSTVKAIKDSAFNGCNSLSSITIPSNVESIEANAFKYCAGLTSFTIESSDHELTLGQYCFSNWTSFTGTLTLPGSVKKLPGYFIYSNHVTNIVFNEGLKELGSRAFWGASYLVSISALPSTLETLKERAFHGNAKIEHLDLSKCTKLTTIPEGCFACAETSSEFIPSYTTKITLPSSITNLGIVSLARTYLDELYMCGSVAPIVESSVFSGDDSASSSNLTMGSGRTGNKYIYVPSGSDYEDKWSDKIPEGWQIRSEL